MACTTQSITTTSSQNLSAVVEQKHQPAMSLHHLSPRNVLSRFRGSDDILSLTSDEVPLYSTRTHPSTPRLESIHASKYLLVGNTIMSCSTEQLSIPQHPTQRRLVVQSAHALPRSVSVADLHLDERPRRSQQDNPELRRVPSSISDLRLLARRSNSAISVSERSQTWPPNTAVSETQLGLAYNTEDEYAEEQRKQRRKEHYKSYQDMHILSMYQENASLLNLRSKQIARNGSNPTTSTDCNISDSETSRDSSPRPKTPSDRLLYEETAKTKDAISEDERVRRVNVRRVQVVEHNQRQDSFYAEAELEIVSVLELLC